MAHRAYHAPLFGINITPATDGIELAFDLARLADTAGIDLVGVQDHPYNGAFLETWTLLTALGGATRSVRLFTNVANLPLRPPAMLGKAAATLDLLTAGRVELGLGSGAIWDVIVGYGGPRRSPGEAVEALEEAIEVLRLIWDVGGNGGRVSFDGRHYRLANVQPGPRPAHPIGIWLGALKPRMLELTGRLADGWSISTPYIPPEQVPELQRIIDDAARSAGRSPAAVRRNYNLPGLIESSSSSRIRASRPGVLIGGPSLWVDTLLRYHTELGMDTFIFSAVGGEERDQARRFAEDVVPAVRAALSE